MSKVLVDRELKPCPFCGSEAGLSKGGRALCSNEGCIACDLFAPVEDWNRRAQPAEAEGVDLHDEIMNLRCDAGQCPVAGVGAELAYKTGHRDARHAAAGMAAGHIAALSAVTAERDASRLDRLDIECEAYGFEGIHEGNRWMIDGPFRTVRDAIAAAMAAKEA